MQRQNKRGGGPALSPLGSSQLLGALRVHRHGPVHAAGEAFLQQELRDVAVLAKRGNVNRRLNGAPAAGRTPLAVPGGGWSPV